MKKNFSLIFTVISLVLFSQKIEDRNIIKAMTGCYEIKFNFAETFNYPKDSGTYKPSEIKHDSALEWAELVEDSNNKISIQHLLVVGKEMVIKHWRQDWIFENTNFNHYNGIYKGIHDFNFSVLNKKEVKGQWSQKVFEVDDSPRYQGSASWVNVDGRTFWQSTTDAPLPRREYTKRSDYNLLKRTNIHQIVGKGWVHNQDNHKIIRNKKGEDFLLAEEKGYNTYTKVEDNKCIAAQNWWKEKKEFWSIVRTKWEKELSNKNLKLRTEVYGEPLHMHLAKLNSKANKEDINKVIDRFIDFSEY